MNQIRGSWGWQLLASALIVGGVATSGNCALGQVVGDTTLGAESSRVTSPIPGGYLINGGATRGTNLFHSFQEFSIPTNGIAFFNNALTIQNIISRVTGVSVSNIDGTIRANGTANLFLINPNGIVFGAGASLNIGGSFFASTARGVVFDNGFEFSATNPQAPPLLTINVPVGLQYGSNAGTIQAQRSLLRVRDGRTLALVGGNVQLDGAGLFALGGRVELAGVGDTGTVGLSGNGNNLSLSLADEVLRSDVSLTNRAEVNVRAGSGGSIVINARNLNLAGRSFLEAGIASGSGSINTQAGDIEINATQAINLDGSFIFNRVLAGGAGKAGDINITTDSLRVTNGAALGAATFGRGDAGNVNITARNTVSFEWGAAFSTVEQGAVGKGGSINITTSSLSFTNGALLSASTSGQGDAGSVNITARDTVFFDGKRSNGFSSGAFSTVGERAVGKGGSVNITTGSLSVTNEARLQATTFGQGDAGSLNITARDTVSFDGLMSGAFSDVAETAVGNGGSVNITTGSLSLTNNAQLQVLTSGQGDAGNVNITARDTVSFDGVGRNMGSRRIASGALSTVERGAAGKGGSIDITTGSLRLTNGAQLAVGTRGRGDAGNVNINARDTVSFDGVSSNGLPSAAFSTVEATGQGKGGNINITTGSLSVTNGAQLPASTRGRGDAGNVNINARDTVSFDGVGSNGLLSASFSTVDENAEGKGGSVNITTGSLRVTNGAQLLANTRGRGNAGDVNITTRDTVSFDGSVAASAVEQGAVGKGGNVNITTGSLRVTNGALVVSSFGQGNAGDINITTRDLLLNNKATIQAQTLSGNGGNITLNVQDLLLLRRNSLISTTAGTDQKGGDGGNMNINAQFIVAVPKEDSDITANAYTGRGGNINITTQGIYGLEFRPERTPLSDITASSQFGVDGTVQVNGPEVDPSRGLAELPTEVVDASEQIDRRCTPAARTGDRSSFTITGRGGLPPSPNDVLQGESVITNWVTLDPPSDNRSSNVTSVATTAPQTPTITEAQSWRYGSNGEVILTAEASNIAPDNPMLTPVKCAQE